jgi:hypothetical protein
MIVFAPFGVARSRWRQDDRIGLSQHAFEFFDAPWEILEIAVRVAERQGNWHDQPRVKQGDGNTSHNAVRAFRQRRDDHEFAGRIFLAQANTFGGNSTRDPASRPTEVPMTGH